MGLRLEVTPSPSEITAGLAEIRKWRRRCLLAASSFLPGTAALGSLLVALTGKENIAVVPGVLWLLLTAWTMIRANLLPCPRCGRTFQPISSLQFRPWRIACVHCGLALHDPAA